MRNIVAVGLCLGLFATVANAQGSDLELYFSAATGAGDVIPPEYAAYENPVLPAAGGTAYLWAFVLEGDRWNGVALQNHGPDATGGLMYNDAFIGNLRWEPPPGSDLDPVGDNYIFGYGVETSGLGHAGEAIADDLGLWDFYIPGTNHTGAAGGHYLIAEYTWAGGDPVFLAPGIGGISLSGADPGANLVYFGFNADGTDRDAPVVDNDVGTESPVADLTFIPEPASLLLLGLAGLLLRRR